MSVRNWSGTRIVLWLAICWLAAGVLVAAADATSDDDFWLVPMLILVVLLLLVPWVIATVWSWNRSNIGNWHFGKFVILWALLLAASLTVRRLERGLEVWPLVLGGVPLLALTWSWLSARERK